MQVSKFLFHWMRIGMNVHVADVGKESKLWRAALIFWILPQVPMSLQGGWRFMQWHRYENYNKATNDKSLSKFQVLRPSLLHCQVQEWIWAIHARRRRTWWNVQGIHRTQAIPVPPGMVQVEGYSPVPPRSTARRIRADFPLWVSFWVQHRIQCERGREFCHRKLDWRRESRRQMHLQVSSI